MDKRLLKPIIVLLILVALYFINNYFQNRYSSELSTFFNINEYETSKIIISSKEDAIELMKIDSTWSISGNDTLIVKNDIIKDLFTQMKELEQQHLVTSKKENWVNYGITDNSGTHLAFINLEGTTEAYYVFGQSKEEYNRCYVRTDQNTNVHLLSSNILYQLQISPLFWGTKKIAE